MLEPKASAIPLKPAEKRCPQTIRHFGLAARAAPVQMRDQVDKPARYVAIGRKRIALATDGCAMHGPLKGFMCRQAARREY
ncbi:hypothetical protein [Dokdonella soli]|uniref:hypothetical protein n=1 Tax=Dokdonella soli TaxID=529810 RepID=UPI0031E13BBA